jgi:hypothetical protein
MLQAAARLAERGTTVAYVCGEESPRQVRMRARRLGVGEAPVTLVPESSLDAALAAAEGAGATVVIIDSIQSVYVEGLDTRSGGPAQLSEAGARLVAFSKTNEITTVVTGTSPRVADRRPRLSNTSWMRSSTSKRRGRFVRVLRLSRTVSALPTGWRLRDDWRRPQVSRTRVRPRKHDVMPPLRGDSGYRRFAPARPEPGARRPDEPCFARRIASGLRRRAHLPRRARARREHGGDGCGRKRLRRHVARYRADLAVLAALASAA